MRFLLPKMNLLTPSEYETRSSVLILRRKSIAQIYKEYQKQLKANNALDLMI